MGRRIGRIATAEGDVIEIAALEDGDAVLRLAIEEKEGGRVHDVGEVCLRPGQAARLADLLEEAVGGPA